MSEISESESAFLDELQDDERTDGQVVAVALLRVADAINGLSRSVRALGNGDAIGGLASSIDGAGTAVSDSIDEAAIKEEKE